MVDLGFFLVSINSESYSKSAIYSISQIYLRRFRSVPVGGYLFASRMRLRSEFIVTEGLSRHV
jgi:hypothetical protein